MKAFLGVGMDRYGGTTEEASPVEAQTGDQEVVSEL